jgi:hypothetical protein
MREFDKIYLSWRKGQGSRRHLVGVLESITNDKFIFNYNSKIVEKAKEEGFIPYTEFTDTTISYNGNVLDTFAQRLIKTERPDIQQFYDFWEIESKHADDKFYLLGHTQGLLPTDNFEFLADYKCVKGLHFLTELAALSDKQIPTTSLSIGDELIYKLEPDNVHDEKAVLIKKGELQLGYIKKVHCHLFHQIGDAKIKLTVKAIDKNGVIKRVFLKVEVI